MCDKMVERTERFDISLTLTSNNPQVRTGSTDEVAVRIKDSTGNDGTVVSIGDDMIESRLTIVSCEAKKKQAVCDE